MHIKNYKKVKMNYKPLVNIEEKIKRELSSLRLVPERSIKRAIRSKQRFFTSPCQNATGGKYFFKARLKASPETRKALLKEIIVNEVLADLFDYDIRFYMPKKIESREVKPEWILFEHIEGTFLGRKREIAFSHLRKKYIKPLCESILDIQRLSIDKIFEPEEKRALELKIHDYEIYKKKVLSMAGDFKKYFGEKMLREALDLFKEKKELLGDYACVLAHGDVHLENILIFDGKILITDWEQAHIDNFVYDLGLIYNQTWEHPAWRNELARQFFQMIKSKREFRELFRMVVLKLTLIDMVCWRRAEIRAKKGRNLALVEKTQRAQKIHQKTAKRALLGFEELIK